MQSDNIAAKPLNFENMNGLQDLNLNPKPQLLNDTEALDFSRNKISLFASDLEKHTACYAWLFYCDYRYHNYWHHTNNVVPADPFLL